MEQRPAGRVGQPDDRRGEDPAVQRDLPDPPLGEAKPDDRHQHRVAQGQQNRDRKFPDAVDVGDQSGVLTRAFGQLDGGGAAQEQGPEYHDLARGHGVELADYREHRQVGHDHGDDVARQPARQLPERPGPGSSEWRVHSFAHSKLHQCLPGQHVVAYHCTG